VLQCVVVCVAVCCSVLQCRQVPASKDTRESPSPLGCWSVLECVGVCCSVLQCVALCCSGVQCGAVRCSASQWGAVWCSALQCGAVCCSALQCGAVCCSALQCGAVCCSVLRVRGYTTGSKQRASRSVCRSLLQYVAVCCSTLQCVAVRCSAFNQCVCSDTNGTISINHRPSRFLQQNSRDMGIAVCCSALQCISSDAYASFVCAATLVQLSRYTKVRRERASRSGRSPPVTLTRPTVSSHSPPLPFA